MGDEANTMRAASAHAGRRAAVGAPPGEHGVGVVGHRRLVEGAGRARGRPVERRLLLELVEHVERPERRDGGHAAPSLRITVRGHAHLLVSRVGAFFFLPFFLPPSPSWSDLGLPLDGDTTLRRATNVVCCMPLPMGFLPAELDLAMAPDRATVGSQWVRAGGRKKWADFGPGTLILIKILRNPDFPNPPLF